MKNLHELAMIDAEKVARRFVGAAFKGCRNATKEMAIEAAKKIVYTLKLVLVLDLKPARDSEG